MAHALKRKIALTGMLAIGVPIGIMLGYSPLIIIGGAIVAGRSSLGAVRNSISLLPLPVSRRRRDVFTLARRTPPEPTSEVSS